MRQAEPARRQAVLLLCGHLAKGAVVAIGQEHRIVAEARGSTWRPHQRAVDARLELLDMAIRPGDAERGYEMRAALRGHRRAACAQLVLDLLHGVAKVARLAGPARRVDAGRAVERIDR